MKIVIIIPAYNEEQNIASVIADIPRNISNQVKVVVIDDGSTDNTANVAKLAGADRVISHLGNKGLGITFRDGIKEALEMTADIIVNIDGDGQFDPLDIPKLVQPIMNNQADMVTCSRFLDEKSIPRMPAIKKLGNKLFTTLINYMTNQSFTDTQCGFRAYSRKAALKMTLFGEYTYTQEVFLDLIEKGFTIKEVACKVRKRKSGKSRLVTNVFSYGIKAVAIIFRTALYYRPLKFLGSIGMILFTFGFIINLVLLLRFIIIHQIYPYLSLLYGATLLIVVGFLVLMLALIADMYDKQRKILEEILYETRSSKK